MNTSADARPSGILRRRAALAAIVLFVVAVLAAIGWFLRRPSAHAAPPPVPANPAEPEVAAFVEKVRQRVVKEPRSPQAWGALGQAFLANGMEAESQMCFVEAEQLDPSNPRWPYYQAGMLLNAGDREAALPYLRRAAARCAHSDPDNPAPRLRLAETLLALGQLDEAEQHFRQVLAKSADNVQAHFDLALIASARQDWQTCRTHLLRCLGTPFAQQKACVQLAVVNQRLGHLSEAEINRQQAKQLPPDQDWSDPFVTEYLTWAVTKRNRYRLADLLEAAGKPREAAAVLRPMLTQYPDDYLPRISLGKILGHLGKQKEAEEILREALRLAPEKIQSHYYLSLVLFLQAEQAKSRGDRKVAEKLYREAVLQARETLRLKPDYGFAYMPLGLSLKGLGQRTEALIELRKAVRCSPEHAELHFYLGDLLAEDGQASEARSQLQQAVDMAPANAPWRQSAVERLAALTKH
jgi:tetratricopeptide (TPR) repeat protein